MRVLPPGTILQHLYIKERIKSFETGDFLEIGSGVGNLSNLLLKNNFFGEGIDLNENANEKNKALNKFYIESGKYKVQKLNFLNVDFKRKFDLIVSCMVIEHLCPEDLDKFLLKCKSLLKSNGTIILLVPSSMKHWGIEDEIAGHYLRYEKDDFFRFKQKYNLEVAHISGLTFPISNLLLRFSNYLVHRSEKNKLELELSERTVLSGDREVPLKTSFPKIFGIFLNEIFLYPFHWLQKLNRNNPASLVMYCELKKSA